MSPTIVGILISSQRGSEKTTATSYAYCCPGAHSASLPLGMKKVSPHLKIKVLGAIELAEGTSLNARYISVSKQIFKDEEGIPHQFTWRTIQTWWYYYRRNGITQAPERIDKGKPRKATPEELLEAIEQALPFFSGKRYTVTAIYKKCIEKGFLRQSQIAENTFRRHVKRFELLKANSAVKNKRRQAFSKANSNDLWQSDTLVGPYLKLNGHPTQVYLICFIDDASRIIPHGEFFTNDNTINLLDCYQSAMFKRGVPKAIYVDNGSNYASKEMSLVCCRLGVVLIHTPVRDGAAKGKIERFFRTVRDQFLIRNLSEVHSLAELNRQFIRWVEDEYHTRKHSTLDMRPLDRFGMDLSRIRYLQPSTYNKEIFYREKTCSVRKDNTFQLKNIRYEPPAYLSGKKITVRFDNLNTQVLPVVYLDKIRIGEARLLNLVANDRKPNLSLTTNNNYETTNPTTQNHD